MKAIFLSRPFILLFAMNFLFFTGLNILNVIPPYLEFLGASKTYVGLFMNINSLALVLLVAPLARFTDLWGRKRLVMIGYILVLVSLLLMFIFSKDLVLLVVFRITGTLIFCLAFTIHGAEAFELLPRDKRASGAAIFGISGLLSNPVASLVGEGILKGPGAPWLFLASFGFLLWAMVLAALYKFHKPTELPVKGAFMGLLKRPELRILLLLTLVFGGGFTIFATFLASLTYDRLGLVQVSVFFTSFTVVAVTGRLFFSKFLDQWPRHLVVVFCITAIGHSLWGGAILHNVWLLVLMGLLYGLGHSLLFPLLSTLFVNSGGDHEKLALNGLFASTNTLGNFVWGLSLGVLGDFAGTGAIFGTMGALALLIVPLAWFCLKNRRD